MPKARKPLRTHQNTPKGDKEDTRDNFTLKPSSYRPGKAEMDEVIRLDNCLDVHLESIGKTPEEQMRNTVRHQFRQVNIRRAK